MVDPHVHFHVIPRYEGGRGFAGIEVADAGWPKVPALNEARELSADEIEKMIAWLRGWWPTGGR
jgi:diadenosine tetraphosphate (Ap4A) HIT family hydrolase